jgi:hypothetical protein
MEEMGFEALHDLNRSSVQSCIVFMVIFISILLKYAIEIH